MNPKPQTAEPADQTLPMVQRITSVLWPSFLTAGLATVVFFSVFDPLDLAQLADYPAISRQAGYTLGFFAFWLLTASSCALTCYFRRPCPPRSPLADTDNR